MYWICWERNVSCHINESFFYIIFFQPFHWGKFWVVSCYFIAGWYGSSKKITHGCFVRASMVNSGDHRKCVSRKASPAALRSSSLKPRVSLSERDLLCQHPGPPSATQKSASNKMKTPWFHSPPNPFPFTISGDQPQSWCSGHIFTSRLLTGTHIHQGLTWPTPTPYTTLFIREGTFCIV